jgi:S-adenosylhomocysteine hydrolase
MLSGILGSTQAAKKIYSPHLVCMRNSRQADNTLNGARVALTLSMTQEVGFLVTAMHYNQAHGCVSQARLGLPSRGVWKTPRRHCRH